MERARNNGRERKEWEGNLNAEIERGGRGNEKRNGQGKK